MALPLEGVRGYGDFWNFEAQVRLGTPFIDFWTEYPPLFPFFSQALDGLSGGRSHAYTYLLVACLSLAQGLSLASFYRIAERLGPESAPRRAWFYLALLIGLAYGWWYIDSLAVWLMLLGMAWLLERRDLPAGLALAAGALTKLFPLLALVAAWRSRPARQAIRVTLIALGATAAVWLGLALIAPQMTTASLLSQINKGSWETPWALLDGNLSTGNFSPLADRRDPATASLPAGNPARIPSWLTLIPFGALGLWLHLRTPHSTERAAAAFFGLAWCVFLLWSPGWSPQWVLYLLPVGLLVLPERSAYLFSVTLVLVNLLEWPVLLSRGYFQGLWLTIPLRTILLILLAILYWQMIQQERLRPDADPAA